MKSIFFISTMNSGAWGGSEVLWFRTALHAINKGHKVGAAVYRWKGKESYLQRLQQAGCSIYQLPIIDKEKPNRVYRLAGKIISPFRQILVLKKIPVSDYDVVVINQGGFREIAKQPWKSLYRQLPNYSIIFHNYSDQYSFKKNRARTLTRWLKNARHLFFASARIEAALEKQLKIKINNGEVIRNPVSITVPAHTSPYPAPINGNFNFTVIAALDITRKSQDQLILVLSSDKWKQRNWVLNLYGDGTYRTFLQELVKKTGLEEKVFLHGYDSNIRKVLEDTHLLLQITRMDAMPLAVVEATAMSRPIAVSPVGDMPEWVREDENGFVSAGISPDDIDTVLERAWQARDRWEEMGRRSFEIFKAKFPEHPEEVFLQQVMA